MIYDEKIYSAVQQAQRDGLIAGVVIFPLINMTASVVANVVAQSGLDPEAELEAIRHELDIQFTKYLDAYRKTLAT